MKLTSALGLVAASYLSLNVLAQDNKLAHFYEFTYAGNDTVFSTPLKPLSLIHI